MEYEGGQQQQQQFDRRGPPAHCIYGEIDSEILGYFKNVEETLDNPLFETSEGSFFFFLLFIFFKKKKKRGIHLDMKRKAMEGGGNGINSFDHGKKKRTQRTFNDLQFA